jgi:hypothetical protein
VVAETEADWLRPRQRMAEADGRARFGALKRTEKPKLLGKTPRSRQEQERKKGVEQRRPERSSVAARIEHGVAACKELNHEL